MSISYEFAGHNLLDWKNVEGLPVNFKAWDKSPFFGGLLVRTRDEEIVFGADDCVYNLLKGSVSLRYTLLENVLWQMPEWATHFWVVNDLDVELIGAPLGKGYWSTNGNKIGKAVDRTAEICGCLFDHKQYPDTVDLVHIKKVLEKMNTKNPTEA